LNDITKSNTIELKEKINIYHNYVCGVKDCQLINLEKDDYNCHLSFCIIEKSHLDEYFKFKQILTKFDEELGLTFKTGKIKDAKNIIIINDSYSQILKEFSNIKSLFKDYVDELIKTHSSLLKQI